MREPSGGRESQSRESSKYLHLRLWHRFHLHSSQDHRFSGLQDHSVGTSSPGLVVKAAGSSGTCDASTITGTPYRGSGSGLQGTSGVGTPASGSQLTGTSSSGSSSNEDRPMWEEHSGKKKPKWLRDTLTKAQGFRTPREEVGAIKMPDRLGMLLVASTRDSEPSTCDHLSCT